MCQLPGIEYEALDMTETPNGASGGNGLVSELNIRYMQCEAAAAGGLLFLNIGSDTLYSEWS